MVWSPYGKLEAMKIAYKRLNIFVKFCTSIISAALHPLTDLQSQMYETMIQKLIPRATLYLCLSRKLAPLYIIILVVVHVDLHALLHVYTPYAVISASGVM